MKKLLLPAAIAAVAATGCVTRPIAAGPQTPPQMAVPAPDPVFYVSEKSEVLKLALVVNPANPESKTFAENVRQMAVTSLRAGKFNLVEDNSDDLGLDISARQTVFNSAADEYFTLDGDVSMRLTDSATHNLLADSTVRARTEPILGKERAAIALSDKIRPDFQTWLSANVTPDQIPLSAAQIQVYGIDSWSSDESGFVRDFLAAVRGMKGVLRCEAESVDPAAKSATFRVFYNRNAYPEGIIPAIVVRQPKFKFALAR